MVSFRFSLMCVFMLSVMTVSGQNVGWATQYGGNSNGNACGYAEVPQSSFPFGLYMACGGSIFDEGYGCGKCYRVTCTGPKDTTRNDCFCDADTPSVIAQCMDQCPECDGSQGTHFDLEEFLTMDTIVADGTGGLCGEIAIAYERVDCAYAGNVKIRSKSGTTGYWYGLHVDDVAGAGAVSSVAIKTNGAASTWLSCVKTAGNPSFFLCDLDGHTPISAPLDVRLINDYGQAIECTDCITNLDASQEFDFGSNFPAISGTPVTTSSSGTTSTATASSQGYIGIQNGVETTEWYLSLYLLNADGSACGETVSNVQILYNNAWQNSDQYYYEAAIDKHRYAWNNFGFEFSQMLDISLRIVTNVRNIELPGVITAVDSSSVFTSTESICSGSGTAAPTQPTVAPTTTAPSAPTTPYPTSTGIAVCMDTELMDWRSFDNELKLNGNRFNLKGLSWFGFETSNYGLYGLDVHSVDWYLDWIAEQGFNAIRLPFSQDFIQTGDTSAYLSVVQKAGQRGILVMPDFHSKAAGAYTEGLSAIAEGGTYSTALATWQTVADLLSNEWNVFAADCYNEPHDVSNAEWPTFVSFCESVADAIWSRGVDWLIVVEGTNWDCMSLGASINCAWGENLMGIRAENRAFNAGTNKVVWSPHVYGEEITGNSWSTTAWQQHWGYLVDGTYPSNVADVMIGEFGTRFDSASQQAWLNGLTDYLIEIDARNTFFWCLNPNSGDTGGLLNDDWTTPRTDKLEVLSRLQPSPSEIVFSSGTSTICVEFNNGATTAASSTSTTAASATAAPTSSNTAGESLPSRGGRLNIGGYILSIIMLIFLVSL